MDWLKNWHVPLIFFLLEMMHYNKCWLGTQCYCTASSRTHRDLKTFWWQRGISKLQQRLRNPKPAKGVTCRSWTFWRSKSSWKKAYFCWINCRFLSNTQVYQRSEKYPSYQHMILGNHNDCSTKNPKHRPRHISKLCDSDSLSAVSSMYRPPIFCSEFTGKRCVSKARTLTLLARGQVSSWPLVSWDWRDCFLSISHVFPAGHWLHRVKPCSCCLVFPLPVCMAEPKNGQLPRDFAINMHWLDSALWLFLLGHLLPSSSGKMMKTSLVTLSQLQNRFTPHWGYIIPESFSLGSNCQPTDHQICDLYMSAENQTVKSVKVVKDKRLVGYKSEVPRVKRWTRRGPRVQMGRKDGKGRGQQE